LNDRNKRVSPTDELSSLMRVIADWSSAYSDAPFYLFGSRVRGDHHEGSDVDLYGPRTGKLRPETIEWLTEQWGSEFASLKPLLPGRLEMLDNDEPLERKIRNSEPYRTLENVTAIWLPPKGPLKL
jgi:predicted nucleotidyltransferase